MSGPTSAGRARARTAAVAGALAAAPLLPSMLSIGPVRRASTPLLADRRLSGVARTRHVALTFDDGPDRASTPRFLELLDALDVRATFFVLGRHVADHGLLREMAEAGHEVGVHGWDHRPAPLHPPVRLLDHLRRTRDLVEDHIGRPVRWYRPPYGVLSPATTWAARRAGLETVLWSAWGRDWERAATATSVTRTVLHQLRPGGTVLLHDSDRTSTPGSWRATLEATGRLVPVWERADLGVGPLGEHWDAEPIVGGPRTPAPRDHEMTDSKGSHAPRPSASAAATLPSLAGGTGTAALRRLADAALSAARLHDPVESVI